MLQPKQESRFEYKGFPCVILFMPMGYRCGYVGLPKENRYYKKKYDDIPVDCHCGLTYSGGRLFGQSDKDTWWIGFDCGHFCDGIAIGSFKKYYMDELKSKAVDTQLSAILGMHQMYKINNEYPVCTQKYAENECRKIVDQIDGGGVSDRTVE